MWGDVAQGAVQAGWVVVIDIAVDEASGIIEREWGAGSEPFGLEGLVPAFNANGIPKPCNGDRLVGAFAHVEDLELTSGNCFSRPGNSLHGADQGKIDAAHNDGLLAQDIL